MFLDSFYLRAQVTHLSLQDGVAAVLASSGIGTYVAVLRSLALEKNPSKLSSYCNSFINESLFRNF